MYFRNATDDGLFRWFSELIQKAVPGDRAILGYHFPGWQAWIFDGAARPPEGLLSVQFAGIKDSSHDAGLARSLGETFGEDLVVLTGTDTYLELAMQNQAAGCITAPANLLSPDLREIWEGMQTGRDVSAAQRRVATQRHILEKYPPFPSALKSLLHRLHGFP